MHTPRSNRADYSYFVPQSVRWRDMDALGHVNHANYLTYAESARMAFFEQLFADEPNFMSGQGPILAEIRCTYHEQLSYPAELDVGVRVDSVGNSSVILRCPVFLRAQPQAVADMHVVLAWFDYQAQQTIRAPKLLRQLQSAAGS